MIRPLALASIATLAFASPVRAQDAGCFKDTDCKGSRICVDRMCVDPPPVRSCGRDLDCPGDDICEQHICLPPANAKKKGGKNKPAGKRDLIKEARDAAEKPASPPTPAPASEETAPPLVSLPPPSATPVPAPSSTTSTTSTSSSANSSSSGPSSAPPAAIAAPPPAETTPPPKPAPAPAASAPAPTPPPALIQTGPETTGAPAPPPDLITAVPPPPPLVAAPIALPPPPEETREGPGPGSPLYGGTVMLGIHNWFANSSSETDFGLDLGGDVGVRFASSFGVELLVQGNYTPMLASRTGLLAAVGLALRLDHLGPMPGHFLIGGMGSFGAISGDSAPTIDISGGAAVVQYAFPLSERVPISLDAQAGLHFLSASGGGTGSLTLFTFTVGVAFGN